MGHKERVGIKTSEANVELSGDARIILEAQNSVAIEFKGAQVKGIKAGVFGTPLEWDGADEWIELFIGNTSATSAKPAFRLRVNPTIAQTTGQAYAMQVQAYGEATAQQDVYSLLGGNFEAGLKAACEVLTGGSVVALRCKVEDLGNDVTMTGKTSALQVAGQYSSGTTMTGVYSLIEFVHEGNIGADCVFYCGPDGGMFQEALAWVQTAGTLGEIGSNSAEWLSSGSLTDSGSADVACDARVRWNVGGTSYWVPLFDTAA